MPNEPIVVEEGVSKQEFSIARKGYDPAEVDAHLAECDVAFRDLEEYAVRLKHELGEAKAEITRLRAAEQESVDQAMRAVFDAKERILKQARLKASEIENRARGGVPVAAATEAVEAPVQQQAPTAHDVESSELSNSSGSTAGADDVLQHILREADTIRSQLKRGLASAFDEMDRRQRDAEERAIALLDDARAAAARLRSAGDDGRSQDSEGGDAKFEVMLDAVADADNGDHRSRYSKKSANLPRIGEGDGVSVLASMNELRSKFREDDPGNLEESS